MPPDRERYSVPSCATAATRSGALAAAQSVATADIAQQAMAEGLSGPKVGERIQAARTVAVSAWLAGQFPMTDG